MLVLLSHLLSPTRSLDWNFSHFNTCLLQVSEIREVDELLENLAVSSPFVSGWWWGQADCILCLKMC